MPPGSSDPLWELGNRQKPSVINRIWIADDTKGLNAAAPDETWCGYRADLLRYESDLLIIRQDWRECVLLQKLCLWLKVVTAILACVCCIQGPFLCSFTRDVQENAHTLSSSRYFSSHSLKGSVSEYRRRVFPPWTFNPIPVVWHVFLHISCYSRAV